MEVGGTIAIDICELLVYEGYQTTAEAQTVLDYLNTKWELGLT
jgi:hypothetical protein